MDNQNQNLDSNQQNHTSTIPQQPNPNTRPIKKPNIVGGLLWLFSFFIVGIAIALLQIIVHFLLLNNTHSVIISIVNIVSVLGGFATIALIPIGIIKAVAKFSGK